MSTVKKILTIKFLEECNYSFFYIILHYIQNLSNIQSVIKNILLFNLMGN